MGIFNEHSSSSSYTTGIESRGERGPPGIGFVMKGGNYSLENRKLVNVKPGTDSNDVVTKSQLDTKTVLLDGSRPGYVTNNKAAVYSGTGSLHAQSLYLKDIPDGAGNSDEVRIMTEHQSYDNIHLYIPDLLNFDGFGGRLRSELMVTSVDQTIDGKNVFLNIQVPNPQGNNNAMNKQYVDITIRTKADLLQTATQSFKSRVQIPDFKPLSHSGFDIVNLKYMNNTFLSKSIGGVMKNPITFLNSLPDNKKQIHNLGIPQYDSSAINRRYVIQEIAKIPKFDQTQYIKKDGSISMGANLDMSNNLIENVKTPLKVTDGANKGYIDEKLSKPHIISSHKNNVFKYLSDGDESSSEYNIVEKRTQWF